MIADRIESLLNNINEKTKSLKMEWRPISEYVDYCNDNEYMSEKIMMLKVNEFIDFYDDKSFFVRQDSSYLFVLTYQETSAIDGTVTDRCELYASFYPNSEVIPVPGYIDGGIKTIRDSIMEYWETENCNYVADVSGIIGVLKKFTD